MTRINIVPVEELSDQHLIAEYNELPRCLKQRVNLSDAPSNYKLGKGHVKWAQNHCKFILNRFSQIISEMEFRGFNHKYTTDGLSLLLNNDYNVTANDIMINRNRIKERFNLKPNWYRWTKRNKPLWLIDGE